MIIPRLHINNSRRFWQWLNIVWNRVDEDRIAAVGPDRACAEWLMRNGAYVKWTGAAEYLTDYNALPPEGMTRHIEEIDATESSIMHYGFKHFYGCKHIKKFFGNLQIISCGNITDEGIKSLKILSKLRTLLIANLPYLKNKEDCLLTLKSSLPSCEIEIN
ncbi:hypothetical protein L9F63_012114 [Diploptera punctata]|uniref:Mitochondrial ATP synthase regulatory component factor B n=1 Tax=Diploptera punctata TaxID=6984 RepID=A0AAD8AFE6_DIPPU|nr:hypothetical protein L9F63_012114 [Diploptera punctata]